MDELIQPDIIHAHHHDPTAQLINKFPNTPIVFTLHGIIGGPETLPKSLLIKENVEYVAVSEETEVLIKHVYKKECTIIRQGIDMERFKPKALLNDEIKVALLSSSYLNHDHPFVQTFRKACNMRGIKPIAIGKDFDWTWETEEAYNKADIVLTIGRGVLEAMACGRPVITFGHWGHSGILTEKEMKDAKKFNFSGRHVRDEYYGWKEMLKAMKDYCPQRNYRKFVQGYKLEDKAEEYLSLYNKLVDAKK